MSYSPSCDSDSQLTQLIFHHHYFGEKGSESFYVLTDDGQLYRYVRLEKRDEALKDEKVCSFNDDITKEFIIFSDLSNYCDCHSIDQIIVYIEIQLICYKNHKRIKDLESEVKQLRSKIGQLLNNTNHKDGKMH